MWEGRNGRDRRTLENLKTEAEHIAPPVRERKEHA